MIVSVIVHNESSKMLSELGNITYNYENLNRKEVTLCNIDAFTSHENFGRQYTEVYAGSSIFIVDMNYEEFSYLYEATR
jgi:hypothetical protein